MKFDIDNDNSSINLRFETNFTNRVFAKYLILQLGRVSPGFRKEALAQSLNLKFTVFTALK
jgi:hypothetical protein